MLNLSDFAMRCSWAGSSEIYINYHDKEWGRPVYDDGKLFEFLLLEGMQAGLSWITILKKRENIRIAFDDFDPEKIACYDNKKIEKLMLNPGIIRNHLKIQSAINNAKIFLKISNNCNGFSDMIWKYIDYNPIVEERKRVEDIPATTVLSDKISRDLKNIGFKFVGSTIIYSFMQAIGMVNDHTIDCFVYKELQNCKNFCK